MTQQDRDDAAILLKTAADDMLANIRHVEGALLGVYNTSGDFMLACDAWYRVSRHVKEDMIPLWAAVALEAAQLLEEGWTP